MSSSSEKVEPTQGKIGTLLLLVPALAATIPGVLYVAGWFYLHGYLRAIDVPFQAINPTIDVIVHLGVGPLVFLLPSSLVAILGLVAVRIFTARPETAKFARALLPLLPVFLLLTALVSAYGLGAMDAEKVKIQDAQTLVVGTSERPMNVTGKVFFEDGTYLYLKDFRDGSFYVVRSDSILFYRYDAYVDS